MEHLRLNKEENVLELISNYMKDNKYRHMLNELTRNTFYKQTI